MHSPESPDRQKLTWARRALRDLYKCPTQTSPRITFYTSAPWTIPPVCNDTVQVGAVACTRCPNTRPHTKAPGAPAITSCSICKDQQFWNGSSCTECSPQCTSPDQYESRECTDTYDRECRTCNRDDCKVGTYAVSCPGPIEKGLGCMVGYPFHSFCPQRSPPPPKRLPRLCARDLRPQRLTHLIIEQACGNAPPNASYIKADIDCAWRCDNGFFSSPGQDSCTECQR